MGSERVMRSPAVVASALLSVVAASVIVLVAAPDAAAAQAYYVAPGGSDSAAGTQAAPWATIARAQSAAQPGDTVYFRGGTYAYTRANSTCAGLRAWWNSDDGFDLISTYSPVTI